eukprot:scaffold8727_cov62-Cyclotella_meneghiniana.AAC.5
MPPLSGRSTLRYNRGSHCCNPVALPLRELVEIYLKQKLAILWDSVVTGQESPGEALDARYF